MSICDDPFSVLGVPREASLAEVTRAYRRLAMRWHPDRHPAAAAAAVASEFARVHAAYELLIDPQRLAKWQEMQQQVAEKTGADCTQSLTLTIEEAALGCRKTVDLLQRVECAVCQGSGRVQHTRSVPCPLCSGCGRVARGAGRTSRCDGCAGRGYLHETACDDCAGSGWRDELRRLAVNVPAGLRDGERLRLARQAPLAAGDVIAGDLYLEISLAEHPLFTVQGSDLHCQVPVSIFRRLCGGRIDVPTLRGATTLDLPPCSPALAQHRLRGLGFPARRRAAAGDLVVHLQSVDPQGLASDDLALLEGLEAQLAADLDRRAPQLAAWAQQLRARRSGD